MNPFVGFKNPSSSDDSSSDTVNSLYNVKVPSEYSPASSARSTKNEIKIVLGRIDQRTKSMIARTSPLQIETIREPFIDMSRDFLNCALNPLTIAFIFLSVVSAIYSSICQKYLLADAEITDTRVFAMPYVAAAIQETTIDGLNATTYNLMKMASSTLTSLSQTYVDAEMEICSSLNDTSSYSSASKQMITTSHHSLLLTNPDKWNAAHCQKSFGSKNAITDSGYATINNLGSAVLANVTRLADLRIPAVNVSTRTDGDFNRERKTVKSLGTCWIVIFSCLAALSVALYWYYDYIVQKYGTEDKVATVIAERAQEKRNGVEHSGTYMHFQNFSCNCGSAYRFVIRYFIDSSINRLLYMALILALLGLSNSTILKSSENTKILNSSTGNTTWFEPTISAYSQYESNFNNNSIGLFSNFVNMLNQNHMQMSREIENMYDFTITSSVPFPNGVALNVMSLPLTQGRKLPDKVLIPGTSLHTVTGILRSLHLTATGCWVSAIVLFCVWACCTICYNIC